MRTGWAMRARRCAAAMLLAAMGSVAAASDGATRVDDLEIARSQYVLRSPAFSPAQRQRALAYIERQKPRVGRMTPEQFLLCVLAIPAYADNGHDVLNTAEGAWWPSARLPLRLIWFPEAWVVARAGAEHADLLGARVLAIEGRSSEAVFRRLRHLWGGPDSSRRWNLQWLVENAGMLHAAGLARRADSLRLDLRLRDGRRVRRDIAFVRSDALPSAGPPPRLWSHDPLPGEAEAGWRSAIDADQPLYLGEADRLFRVVPLPQMDALYLQMRSNYDSRDQTLAEFMARADAALTAHRPRHLVFDLRFNLGGNSDLTREWLRSLPGRVPGTLYVLTSRYTFSAGIVAAAALRHDGGARVRLVGEAVGDRLAWWSEGQDVCLPASHYCAHLTTGLWNLASGCAGTAGCYGDRFDARVGDLQPQIDAPLDSAAWLAQRDPAMEAIERELVVRGTRTQGAAAAPRQR